MTNLRTAAQQALEALEEYQSKGAPFLACDGAVAALRAALAQQEEPVKPAPLKRGITGRCARKVCECEKEGLGPECIYLEPVIDGYPLWSGIPKAEPDHETRAELAEQQVVQLAEERDHYRNLWQKAQQAEPVEPVAWITPGQDLHLNNGEGFRFSDWTPLYPAPPQRLPLTEEEINAEWHELDGEASALFKRVIRKFARAIERAHGTGETK